MHLLAEYVLKHGVIAEPAGELQRVELLDLEPCAKPAVGRNHL